MKNKKGQALMRTLMVVLLVALVPIAFLIIPSQQQGFWSDYGYTPGQTNISKLDQQSEASSYITQIACDINGETSCSQPEKKNVISQIGGFINGMVQGGYGAIVTVYKSWTITKVLIDSLATLIGVPTEIATILTTLFLLFVVMSMVYLIFNRSDA